jgi:hypothetical protein
MATGFSASLAIDVEWTIASASARVSPQKVTVPSANQAPGQERSPGRGRKRRSKKSPLPLRARSGLAAVSLTLHRWGNASEFKECLRPLFERSMQGDCAIHVFSFKGRGFLRMWSGGLMI